MKQFLIVFLLTIPIFSNIIDLNQTFLVDDKFIVVDDHDSYLNEVMTHNALMENVLADEDTVYVMNKEDELKINSVKYLIDYLDSDDVDSIYNGKAASVTPSRWTYGFTQAFADLENGETLIIANYGAVIDINAGLNVPEGVNLSFVNGAIISPSTEQSLTFGEGASFSAPITKIFGDSLNVYLSNANITKVYPEWWGAMRDGVTDDGTSIQRCIGAAKYSNGNIKVQFLRGNYYTSLPIQFSHKAQLAGAGEKATYLVSSAKNIFEADSLRPITDVELEGFNIRGDMSVAEQNGVYISMSANDKGTGGMWYSRIANLDIANLTGTAIYFNNDTLSTDGFSNLYIHQFNTIENMQITYCEGGALKVFGFADQFFINQLETTNNNTVNIDLNRCNTFLFNVLTSQGKGSEAARLTTCNNITFNTCWLEGLDWGIYMTGTGNNRNIGISIINTKIINVKYTAIYAEDLNSGIFTSNRFWVTEYDSTTALVADFNSEDQNILWRGNTFNTPYAGKGYGYYPYSGVNAVSNEGNESINGMLTVTNPGGSLYSQSQIIAKDTSGKGIKIRSTPYDSRIYSLADMPIDNSSLASLFMYGGHFELYSGDNTDDIGSFIKLAKSTNMTLSSSAFILLNANYGFKFNNNIYIDDEKVLSNRQTAVDEGVDVNAASGTTITDPDAGNTYGTDEATLINNLKAQVNTLITLTNDLKTKYNDLVSSYDDLLNKLGTAGHGLIDN